MKLEQLEDVMHAAPFRPFVIHVADGTQEEVPHPDFIAIMARRTAIVTFPDNRRPSYRLIEIPLITQLEISGNAPNGMTE
jgi:hypothetical protein